MLQSGRILLPTGIVVDREEAAVVTRLKNRARDNGCHRNIHAIGQRQVPQNHGRTTDGAMRANSSAACNTHTAGHGRVRANMHVVANLYQIIELLVLFRWCLKGIEGIFGIIFCENLYFKAALTFYVRFEKTSADLFVKFELR